MYFPSRVASVALQLAELNVMIAQYCLSKLWLRVCVKMHHRKLVTIRSQELNISRANLYRILRKDLAHRL